MTNVSLLECTESIQDHLPPMQQIQVCVSNDFILTNNSHLNLIMDLAEVYNLAVWEKNKPFIINIYLPLFTVASMRIKLPTIRVSALPSFTWELLCETILYYLSGITIYIRHPCLSLYLRFIYYGKPWHFVLRHLVKWRLREPVANIYK